MMRMSEPGHQNMIALTGGLRKGSFGANVRTERG
jgi:hypothetical protein